MTDTPTKPSPELVRDTILAALDRMKGEDTLTIDLNAKTDVTNYMVIASGASTTKVGAMAMEIRKDLKKIYAEILSVDGTQNKDWVLIDANHVVVHLFRPPVREFYNLEKLWAPDVALARLQAENRTGEHPLDVESDEDMALEEESDS